MDKNRHKEVIDGLNKLVDDGGKNISAKLLKRMNVRALLGNRQAMKKVFMATAIKQADPLFSRIKTIGNDFAQEKISAALESHAIPEENRQKAKELMTQLLPTKVSNAIEMSQGDRINAAQP